MPSQSRPRSPSRPTIGCDATTIGRIDVTRPSMTSRSAPRLPRGDRARPDRGADGRVVWDMDAYGFVDGDRRRPRTRASGARPADRDPRAVRDRAGLLPGPRLRPLEHGDRRGRRRDRRRRSADLGRERGRRAGPLPRAPRRPPGDRCRVQPQPHRPFRRRAGVVRRGRRRRAGAGPGARGVPRARGERERLRRHGDGRRAGYMYGALLERGPRGRSRRARAHDVDRP